MPLIHVLLYIGYFINTILFNEIFTIFTPVFCLFFCNYYILEIMNLFASYTKHLQPTYFAIILYSANMQTTFSIKEY